MIDVFMNPFAADACMNPLWPVVKSFMTTSNACCPGSPGTGASNMCTRTLSPGFINSVSPFGVALWMLASCGLGGPAGIPFLWMNAKFSGSSHCGLHWTKFCVHSRLSIVSAEHQWVSSQPLPSTHGGKPGG